MLEESQSHINKGLEKLKETEKVVKELSGSLKIKQEELEIKNSKANETLNNIMTQQENAEQRKKKLKELDIKLKEEQVNIDKKSEVVKTQLSEAEPALEAAKLAVQKISKNDIRMVRSLGNPPKNVKIVLTAVTHLLEGHALKWKEIQKVMKKSDFIDSIKNLDVDSISKKFIKKMKKIQEYNFDKKRMKEIKKSYEIAGILAEWFMSQLHFSDILNSVDPLRKEIDQLKQRKETVEKEQQEGKKELQELELLIKDLKQNYSSLIGEVEKIKKEMEGVQIRVKRSKSLLANLSSEKTRWSRSNEGFHQQMQEMTGNVLLCSAFLTYCGFFDQLYRNMLLKTWQSYLVERQMQFHAEMVISKYVSSSVEQMEWKVNHLPDDELCIQNALIIKKYNRYPLIIDPSGQAQKFILSYYSKRKIEKTTYDDPNFLKVLEKCLRFGLPILIQNVEKMEPFMNSVLNKEVFKQGGRVLVRVGDQEIDFNRNFELFMITVNPNCRFTPDLCSRVTFVNFTITQNSLENQCINMFLRRERPDIEKKRITLLKLQGEYLIQIRRLEDDLLKKISEQTGSILDNLELINSLE